MKEDRDYVRDIAEIRSMMERSSRFLSLSGWAGVMAGVYALVAAYIAWAVFDFSPEEIMGTSGEPAILSPKVVNVIWLAVGVLVLAVGTAVFLSGRRAGRNGEKVWNSTVRRLVVNMAVPLVAGGLLILILISKGLIGLVAPFTLIFYGIAMFNASKFTFEDVKIFGLVQLGLGLIGSYFIEYGLLLWALGFGIIHIIYGIYLHYRYER